jgi:hypothetical protein
MGIKLDIYHLKGLKVLENRVLRRIFVPERK